ncbi:MAG: cadmium-translocating P-type ATPase [Hadesarchaea archaeon]|nr:cadmium-translocating P-type ATPase [Hadesarchaea archaeon]
MIFISEHNANECPYCKVDLLREKPSIWKRRDAAIISSSGILFGIGVLSEFVALWNLVSLVLFLVSGIIPGVFIVRRSVRSLLARKLDVHILMTVAAAGAFLIGYWAEGAAVLLLFYVAEFLEDYAGERARRSVSELLELSPETAVKKTADGEEEVHTHEVELGEIILVKPGERIPLDGEIVEGSTSVNQAPVTGESISVPKSQGDEVFGGTMNEGGYIEVKVTKRPGETTLSKIVKLVESAQKRKSKTEKLVNKFASYYTPIILALAALVAIVPTLLFSLKLENWIYRALVLLTVSCPCAFVLSTPVSMVSGITSAARNGLLIKGGTFIEKITQERVLAFDKTRTLTEGRPQVTDVAYLNDVEEKALQIAVSLESKSSHPIADAIMGYGDEKGIDLLEVQNFESVPGKGIIGTFDDEEYLVGTRDFFNENNVDYPKREVKELEKQGKTVILVGNRSEAIAIIGVKDKIRENAAQMIRELREQGIRTVMLTGDNERVARVVAREVGVDEYHSGLLPEEKVNLIRSLQDKYEHVSMLGDGINDAPALAEAHVGIAMGAAGSDVAIETADIVLMEDDLDKVNYLMRLGDKTMSTIRENIAISIITKGALAILAVLGFVSLAVAVGVGDMGISFLVIMNALKLGLVK